MVDLEDSWPALLAGHIEIRDRLLAAYDDPRRGYHDRQHLTEVLEWVDVLLDASPGDVDGSADRDAVVLAAWFHDAVYEGAGDDEERSAALAERELATAGLPSFLVREVARLVRLTAAHRPEADDVAGAVLCDADLAILASDDAHYAEYLSGVRREFADITDGDFRSGRARVLRQLLDAASLFGTRYGREHWEQRARDNLRRELEVLDAPAP